MSEPLLQNATASPDDIPASRLASITVGGFKVDELIFTHGFVQYCNITHCGGGCCHSGVYADMGEHDRILEHASEIARAMDETQDTDVKTWFDGEIIEDTDFPSGRAIGTEVHDRDGGVSGFTEGCVFLDKRHFCSIQVAAADAGLHRWAWKPKYCILFPVTVVEGTITYDDSHSEDLHYCGPQGTANYVHSVFEAMQEELRYFLGEEEFAKLTAYYQANRERFELTRQTITTIGKDLVQVTL
ncbi:MAG TPA: DUF3109 family protein [Candidatus Kapabacteria bacterium]|jgi:hypothetical protein|nr:DUF3109 family protein [Candidatus Kapabacteria bacterium]